MKRFWMFFSLMLAALSCAEAKTTSSYVMENGHKFEMNVYADEKVEQVFTAEKFYEIMNSYDNRFMTGDFKYLSDTRVDITFMPKQMLVAIYSDYDEIKPFVYFFNGHTFNDDIYVRIMDTTLLYLCNEWGNYEADDFLSKYDKGGFVTLKSKRGTVEFTYGYDEERLFRRLSDYTVKTIGLTVKGKISHDSMWSVGYPNNTNAYYFYVMGDLEALKENTPDALKSKLPGLEADVKAEKEEVTPYKKSEIEHEFMLNEQCCSVWYTYEDMSEDLISEYGKKTFDWFAENYKERIEKFFANAY